MAPIAHRPCVTGIGLITPIGLDPDTFWNSLVAGRSGARPVHSFDTADLPNHLGCEIEEVAPVGALGEPPMGGRCTQFAALAAAQALGGSGLDPSRAEGVSPLALVVGTTMGDVTQFEQDRAAHAAREADEADVRSLALRPLDVMSRALARIHRLSGPVITVPAACAAGNYAIGVAASLVARGEAGAALAVGCEAFSRLAFVGFSRMRAMSPDVCRPFSRGRPGLLLGEGAAALVIEPETAARARGAEILGFVDGFGLSCDAHHITGPRPDALGAIRALQDALARARLDRGDVDYISAHGTGTPLNDKVESLAVHAVFGDRARLVPISSIKALTGHMMGAAGAVEAAACLLAMRHGVIPPTWNWTERDPECDVDCVPNEPRPAKLRRVVSNSYAFGGNNSSLVLSSPAS